MKDINEKILSMDYSEYRTQIKTVDAQETLNGGVLLLVTGYLFGNDNVRRDFTQSFLLATQETGYYVLNDIFRFVEEAEQQQEQQGLANETGVPSSAENGIARKPPFISCFQIFSFSNSFSIYFLILQVLLHPRSIILLSKVKKNQKRMK